MMVSVTYNGEPLDIAVEPNTRASQLVANCRRLWGILNPSDLALSTDSGLLLEDGDFVTTSAPTPVHTTYTLRPRHL